MADLGDDTVRVAHRLPGIAANESLRRIDFSANRDVALKVRSVQGYR